MANFQHNVDITFHEIEYSFLIREKEKGTVEFNDILKSELNRFEDPRRKTGFAENPIFEFLRTNIGRSVNIPENTRIYITDYQEKGAYAFQFIILVISGKSKYLATRQAIDELIKVTIGNYFQELIARHQPVNVSVHSVDNQIYELYANSTINERIKRLFGEKLPLILASVALFVSITTVILWLLQTNHQNQAIKAGVDERDKCLELMIEKRITDALNQEKLNYLFYKNSAVTTDSIQQKYNKLKR